MRKLIPLALALALGACHLPIADCRLVVVIVVDQMRPDYLERFDADFTGGLRRLIDGGRIYEHSVYEHAITSTAPGHGVIATGTHPSAHGFVGNSWYDTGTGELLRCSSDPGERLLIGEGIARSPRRLLRTGVGDWLKKASPRSQVVAIAEKARSAVAMGGQRPDWAIWRDGVDFVSSSYYGEVAPPWLRRWNEENDFSMEAEEGWTDDEIALFSMARTALDALQLGRDGDADLLFLGCSIADYVGHRHGPNSEEVRRYYQKLDRELGDFLDYLDRELGDDRYRVLLSSDHGVMDLPEELAADGLDARRIGSWELTAQFDSLSTLIAERADIDEPAFANRYVFGVVYGDALRARLDDELKAFVVESLLGLPSVEAVYARDGSVGDDEYAALFRNGFHPSRGFDLYLRHRENWLVGAQETGTSHGSCYLYDRQVPLLAFGPGIERGRVPEPVSQIQIAPTLARWLGVPTPGDLPGQPLSY